LVASLTLVVLLLASCGDTADDSADTTIAATTTTTAAPTTTTTVETTTETMEAFSAVFDVTYVEGEGCTSVGPSKLPTGEHSFVLHDPTGELEYVWIIRLDEGRTLQDAIDAAPGPGKWYPKPSWQHYTMDLDSGKETDDGTVFVKGLTTPGPHLVVVSLYNGVATAEDRIFWWCDPSFTVVESSE
jgi:hypothetical protein